MKKLIISTIIAIAAVPAAASESDWTIKSNDGNEWRVMPTTVRVYQNEHGGAQVDALVELKTPSKSERVRWGVTGCKSGFGLASIVTQLGGTASGAKVFEWALEGDRTYDNISALVCFAALRQEKKVRQGREPSV